MNASRIFVATGYALSALLFLGLGYLVANAGWWIPSTTPLTENVAAPLTTGPAGQIKTGRLWLNHNNPNPSPSGLFVFGNPTPSGCALGSGAGCVGIGTSDPQEKLDVVGSVNISSYVGNQFVRGLIKPNGDAGAVNQTLTSTGPNSMAWEYDNAWMTIERIDINSGGSCFSFFPPCPTGWQEYSTTVFNAACSQLPTWTYGNAVRVCYQQMHP